MKFTVVNESLSIYKPTVLYWKLFNYFNCSFTILYMNKIEWKRFQGIEVVLFQIVQVEALIHGADLNFQ